MLAAEAAVQADDAEALEAQLGHWLRQPKDAQEQGKRALAFVQKQRGSLEKIMQLLEELDLS